MSVKNKLVVVPEENVTINFAVTEDKPFNKCFECTSFRNGCIGPNLIAMGLGRACEFLQMARIFLGFSYQYVADETGLSLANVKRTLAGKNPDPGYFTMKALSDFLLGDPNGKPPCSVPDYPVVSDNEAKLSDALRELERTVCDKEDLRKLIDGIHDSYKAEMSAIREDGQKKVDFLIDENHRLRSECESWRKENERKAKIIDEYIIKIIK